MMMVKLDEILAGATSVGIAGHVRPDGDAVGSCLGLYNFIREAYPAVSAAVHLEEVRPEFRFLAGADRVITAAPEGDDDGTAPVYDVFFCLDCGDEKRLGANAVYMRKARRTVCIDHHISNRAFAQDNYIVPDSSSTSELIFDLIGPERISFAAAEALYLGIVHDTGVFRHSCTSRHTMEAAGYLMDKGIDYSRIISDTFYAKTWRQNRMKGKVLLESRLFPQDGVIAGCLTREELDSFAASASDTEGIVSALLETSEAHVSVFLYEIQKGSFRVSLRSKGRVDVNRVAGTFGGGGHVRAAGCTIWGREDKVLEKLLGEIRIQMREEPAENRSGEETD